MTPKAKKIIFGSALLAVAAGVSFYNKVQDLTNNVKFFIDKIRIHGLVGGISYIRLFTTVRLINQAQSNLNVNDIQVFVQYVDGANLVDLGGSLNSTNISIAANSTKAFEIGTDLKVSSIPWDKIPALLQGKAVTIRVTTSFTAFGKRITVPADQQLQLPSLVVTALQLIYPPKNTVKGILPV